MKALVLTGRTFGRLAVTAYAGRSRPTQGGRTFPMWECVCDCGATTTVRSTSLTSGNTTSCGCLHLTAIRSRRKERVGYHGAHDRVRAARGRADAHHCIDCGSRARDWSYDGSDPHERKDPTHPSRYSLDPRRYVPRCRRCHVRLDRGSRTTTVVRSGETEGAA